MLSIILQATTPGSPAMSNLFMIGMIVVVFYFFMIRPQMKKAKVEKQFKEEIKKGDKIVTIGGVHGKITDVQDKTFTIEIADNVRVKIEKSAISPEATKQYQTPAALPEKK